MRKAERGRLDLGESAQNDPREGYGVESGESLDKSSKLLSSNLDPFGRLRHHLLELGSS